MKYASKNLQHVNFNKELLNFGLRFKAILKKRGITQRKFSQDTDTHPGLVSRYTNGERPSGDFIMKAISYFPEETLYLFFGETNNSVEEPQAKYGKTPEASLKTIETELSNLKRFIKDID